MVDDALQYIDPPLQIGPYRITRCIGRGGMGLVFNAVHCEIGRHVAVKILRADLSRDAQIAERFLNEARAVSVVRHPGLVEVFDFGRLADGSLYLLMEFLEGESLQARLRRQVTGLPLPEAVRITRQIASALTVAHRKGIVHRDIKPGNLFLVPDADMPSGLRVKVLDFGVAKLRGVGLLSPARHTRQGVLLGTPAYMSPEQARGLRDVDGSSDVYSLAAVLFEMLTGQTPFRGTPHELIFQHLMQPPPRLEGRGRGVPHQVAELFQRMMDKDPGLRPTMEQVSQVMERLAIDEEATLPGPMASTKQHRPPQEDASWFGGAPAAQPWQREEPADTFVDELPTMRLAARHIAQPRRRSAAASQRPLPGVVSPQVPTLASWAQPRAPAPPPPVRSTAQWPADTTQPPAAPAPHQPTSRWRRERVYWIAFGIGLLFLAGEWTWLFLKWSAPPGRQAARSPPAPRSTAQQPLQAPTALATSLQGPQPSAPKLSGASAPIARSKPSRSSASEAPKPPSIAPKAEEGVEGALREAQIAYGLRRYQETIKAAMPLCSQRPWQSWRLIGAAACGLRQVALAERAYQALRDEGKAYVRYECSKHGIVRDANTFFDVKAFSAAASAPARPAPALPIRP